MKSTRATKNDGEKKGLFFKLFGHGRRGLNHSKSMCFYMFSENTVRQERVQRTTAKKRKKTQAEEGNAREEDDACAVQAQPRTAKTNKRAISYGPVHENAFPSFAEKDETFRNIRTCASKHVHAVKSFCNPVGPGLNPDPGRGTKLSSWQNI